MGRPEYYYIMAFDTTTDAMQAERHAKERIKAAIMPIPGAISSGCGLALRFMAVSYTHLDVYKRQANSYTLQTNIYGFRKHGTGFAASSAYEEKYCRSGK